MDPITPTANVETITPQLAGEYLKLNRPDNRPIDWKTVARYARLMAQDLWALDGMSIKFGWDGLLIDGQHRLHAVIRSGKPIRSFVARQLDPATFDALDRGRLRSTGQTLHTKGFRNGTALASAAIALAHDLQNALDGSWQIRLEPRELTAIIEAHPRLIDSVSAVKVGCCKLHCNTGVVAWCHYRFSEIDRLLTESFFSTLFSGEGLTREDPIFLLRSRLIENAGARTKLPPRDIAALVIKTWNAIVDGREMRQLKALRRTEGAESFPRISGRRAA